MESTIVIKPVIRTSDTISEQDVIYLQNETAVYFKAGKYVASHFRIGCRQVIDNYIGKYQMENLMRELNPNDTRNPITVKNDNEKLISIGIEPFPYNDLCQTVKEFIKQHRKAKKFDLREGFYLVTKRSSTELVCVRLTKSMKKIRSNAFTVTVGIQHRHTYWIDKLHCYGSIGSCLKSNIRLLMPPKPFTFKQHDLYNK